MSTLRIDSLRLYNFILFFTQQYLLYILKPTGYSNFHSFSWIFLAVRKSTRVPQYPVTIKLPNYLEIEDNFFYMDMNLQEPRIKVFHIAVQTHDEWCCVKAVCLMYFFLTGQKLFVILKLKQVGISISSKHLVWQNMWISQNKPPPSLLIYSTDLFSQFKHFLIQIFLDVAVDIWWSVWNIN